MGVGRGFLFGTCSELEAVNYTRPPGRWMYCVAFAEASGTFDLEMVSMLLARSSVSIFISLFSFSRVV